MYGTEYSFDQSIALKSFANASKLEKALVRVFFLCVQTTFTYLADLALRKTEF